MLARENDIGFLLKKVHDDLDSVLNKKLSPLGVTSSQADVLRFLDQRENERTTLRDVEKYLGVSHPTVVGLINRLVEKGLVISSRDPEDGRARNLSLNPRLSLAVEKERTADRVNDVEYLLTRGFSEEEIEMLRRMLRKMLANLQNI